MMAEWEEFEGGQLSERFVRTRVTLSVDGVFYFGKKAFESLGMPEAVKLYFDAGRSRIGVKPVESGDKTLALKLEEHGYAWLRERQVPEALQA